MGVASNIFGGLSQTDKHTWEGFKAPQPFRKDD